jgi:very-short-patch-repair endonuclease
VGLPVRATSVATVTVRPELVLRGFRLRPRRSLLMADDVCLLAGVRVTTRARTAVDLLALLPWSDARNLWAWLVTRRLLDLTALLAATKSRTHLVGTPQLRRLAETAVTGSLSEAEDLFHHLMHAARLDGWTPNATITVDGRILGVADVLFEAAKVVVEIDGWAAHRDRQAFQRDRTRQNGLVAAGYLVLRFTWEDLSVRPAYVVATVRAALARIS